MLIDFHTHAFPDELAGKVIPMIADKAAIRYYTEATNTSLLKSMEIAGIDMSVVLPVVTKPSQHITINETAKYINEKYFPRLLSFGGIHPDNENYREILKGLIRDGIKGIKLHPLYQGVAIDDIRNLRIIENACELGMIVVIHAGRDLSFPGDLVSPERISRMLDEIHPDKMVLAHMGSYAQWDEVYDILCGRGAYLDTSFALNPVRPMTDSEEGLKRLKENPILVPSLTQEKFIKMVKKNGVDRILFASDSPWCDQKETYELVNLCLEEKDKNAVFFENALKLLDLSGFNT
ncbi:MAG: amidohydrolase family protein [Lachnospiraceae bacterium]|nr:amidohydrolase family protein [Lachnospiraceae bacterium]